MFKLGIKEYIRNGWYNIVTVIILVVMIIAISIFMSNVEKKTAMYRLVDEYMDENSVIVQLALEDITHMLNKVEKSMFTRKMNVALTEKGKFDGHKEMVIYSEDQMKYLSPRLDEGVLPDKVDKGDDVISVAISHNPFGLKAGDKTIMTVINGDGTQSTVDVYITGIISEGQKVPYMSLYQQDMSYISYETLFETYNYKQTDTVVIVVPEKELEKFPKPIFINYKMGIINFQDDITEEELEENLNIIRQYEGQIHKFALVDSYPKSSEIMKLSDELMSMELKKYVPLTIAVFILLLTCIVGIVSIKAYGNIKYYAVLHIVGMNYKKATVLTAMEMALNCGLAVLIGKIIITLQQKFKLVGVINCYPAGMTWVIIIGMLGVIVGFSMMRVRKILKENTVVGILRE